MPDLLKRIQTQSILFSEYPSRVELLQLGSKNITISKSLSVNVWRNHNFEVFEELAKPYLNYAALKANFILSDYDNSLSFADWKIADLELIWLDPGFYNKQNSMKDWISWLQQRTSALRSKTTSPILMVTWNAWDTEPLPKNILDMEGAFLVDLNAISQQLNIPLIDERTAQFAGTPVSRKIQPIISRYLACHWLSGILLSPIKSLALDLDNTLHDGVLGEDGVNGVSINHEFRELQKRILKLKESGIFLILISKNEHKDVKQLFAARTDYPLQWDDFSVIKASWDSKAKAIAQAAKELNISTDAILFIDDNIGELNHVASHCQAVHILHASSATNTTRAIQFYPGLWRWQSSHDASLRIADMKANRLRNELKSSLLSESDYFKSLEVRLTIRYDDRQNITRLAELCEKTNQFNLAISRFNQTQIQNFMHSQNMSVISIALSDRLSDSGTIAVMVTEKNKETLIVREACISCRALGRNLENDIILSALKHVRFIHHCTAISLIYNKGERNQPAKKWLDETLSVLGNKETLMMDKTKLLAYQPGEGLLLNIGEDSWTSSK